MNQSFFDAHTQDKTNRRLGRLTMLSAIFMPITFLAGVWGMNFEYMPELTRQFGYLMTLATMCLVGGVLYFLLRKMGWFN